MKIEIKEDGKFLAGFFSQYDHFKIIKSEHSLFDGYDILTIKGVSKPKKQAIKDLGKAVNWLEIHCCSYDNDIWSLYNESVPTLYHVGLNYIRAIIKGKQELPDWWPDELTE